jgi:hypothetical protein
MTVPIPKLRETKAYQRVTAWTKRHERYWIPLMLVGGLSGDVIQFSALNVHEKFAIQAVYVVVACGSLLLLNRPDAEQVRGLRTLRLVAPFLHQFAVGGLLSTALLFYWFSGTVSVSWPILLIVAAFMLSNEFLRAHFLRPSVQVGVLSFCLFSLASILFSFTFRSFEPATFVGAGLSSLAFMIGFVFLLARVARRQDRVRVWAGIVGAVFVLMNAAYFLNVIPPIPLSIRTAGIYHDVRRAGNDYALTGEDEPWWQRFLPGQTVHVAPGDSLFAYTAVFAPADLSTTIVHRWQYQDSSTRAWVTKAVISFPIDGGRQDGYRGFTRMSHLLPGAWRVSVETTRGQVLGRIPFTVAAKAP